MKFIIRENAPKAVIFSSKSADKVALESGCFISISFISIVPKFSENARTNSWPERI